MSSLLVVPLCSRGTRHELAAATEKSTVMLPHGNLHVLIFFG